MYVIFFQRVSKTQLLCDKCHYTREEVLASAIGRAPGLRSMRATAKRCAMPPPNEWPVT